MGNLIFEENAGGFVLHNGLVKLQLRAHNHAYTQEYFALVGDEWRLLCVAEQNTLDLTSPTELRDISIGRETQPELHGGFGAVELVRKTTTRIIIKLSAEFEQHHVEFFITLKAGEKYFHCIVEDHVGEKSLVEYIGTPLMFTPGREAVSSDDLDITWVPHQRPLSDHVVGDHSFRSPVLILQKAQDLVFLAPDVDLLSKNRVMKTAIDFEVHGHVVTTPTFGYGFKDWVPDRHVYFSHLLGEGTSIPSDGGFRGATSRAYLFENACLRYGYYLYLDAQADRKAGRRMALDFLWQVFARPYLETQWPQTIPFEEYVRYMMGWATKHEDTIWQKLNLNGKTCGAALRFVTNKGARINSPIYTGWHRGWHGMFLRNTVWDCNVRTAFAYHYFGSLWKMPTLLEKAEWAKEFALSAPQENGVFPTVFVPHEKARWNSFSVMDYDRGTWELSDSRRPDAHEDFYHTADMSYSATWLLRWNRTVEETPQIIEYLRAYADFLVEHQLPSGAIPAWVHTGTFEPSDVMKESAETSPSLQFLAEFYNISQEQRYIDAARKAASFIMDQVIPEGKWEDFETYFSCATLWEGKQMGAKDPHTGIYPQNTLCIQWGADAMLSLYKVTGDRAYLDAGIDALDQLCLYQQVWNASFLTIPTFGGFCSQNTDGEWTDLRSALFALTLLDYYDVTGLPEYFERAVAAHRACFALLYVPENSITHNYMQRVNHSFGVDEYGVMWENMAHGGDDIYWDGHWVNFHWFMAPAVAAGVLQENYGGVYVDPARRQVFGVDGCLALDFQTDGNSIYVNVKENLNFRRDVWMVIEQGQDYEITVDGAPVPVELHTAGKARVLLNLQPFETRTVVIDRKA